MKKVNGNVLKLVALMVKREKARIDRFPSPCAGIWHQPKRPIRK